MYCKTVPFLLFLIFIFPGLCLKNIVQFHVSICLCLYFYILEARMEEATPDKEDLEGERLGKLQQQKILSKSLLTSIQI